MSRVSARRVLLESLLCLREQPNSISRRLGAYPWDAEHPLVRLEMCHLVDVLDRFIKGEINASIVEAWANAVESREDIELDPTNADALRDAIFELANPLLTRPITQESATDLRSVLA